MDERTRFKTLVNKHGIGKGEIGLNRTVEGDKGIVLYFGLREDGPEYVGYAESEVVCID